MVVGAISVVDVAGAEVDGTAVDNGRHSVHLVAAEKRSLDARLAVAVLVDRFDLLGGPVGPIIVIVGDGETERVGEFVGNNAGLLCVGVEAWGMRIVKDGTIGSSRRVSYIQFSDFRRRRSKFLPTRVKAPASWEV